MTLRHPGIEPSRAPTRWRWRPPCLSSPCSGDDATAPPDAPLPAQIAFATDRDGNLEIYAMNPDGTGLTNITNHPAFDTAPAWLW